MNLYYSLQGAPNGHPKKVMEELGITYFHATPQSLGDCWWFWCCENVPKELPSFLSPLSVKPELAIGYGLSKKEAESIELRMKDENNAHGSEQAK